MRSFKYNRDVQLPSGVTVVPCEFINEGIINHLDEEGCDTSIFYLWGDYLYVKQFGSRLYCRIQVD